MNTLTPYEQRRLDALNLWLQKPPGWIDRSLDRVSSPAVRAMQNIVPPAAIAGALGSSNRVADRLADRKSILRKARVADAAALAAAPLERCDKLAISVQRRASVLAGSTGAVTGIAGALGSTLDIPALMTLSLRCIHRTGLCYGEPETPESLALTVLALASANQQQDRLDAMQSLISASPGVSQGLALEALERATHRELAKQSASASLNNLARQLGLNLGRRKAAGSVPVLGAVIGGSLNAWFIHDVCTSAQFGFIARRLAAQAPGVPALTNRSATE